MESTRDPGARPALVAALVLVFALSLGAGFWTMGEAEDWQPRQPWSDLSMVAAAALGVAEGRWRAVLAALLVLPLGLGPEMGAPDGEGATLTDWWALAGPMWALVYAVVIALGVLARRIWRRTRRRNRPPGGAAAP